MKLGDLRRKRPWARDRKASFVVPCHAFHLWSGREGRSGPGRLAEKEKIWLKSLFCYGSL